MSDSLYTNATKRYQTVGKNFTILSGASQRRESPLSMASAKGN